MDARKLIGWNLRELRVERGLSQERLALEAAIDRSYVGRIERGEENVTISVLEALAAALDVRVGRFFAEVDPVRPRPAAMRAGRKPSNT
ncbi:helix-turn-helix domain-containing protein [Neorhizobium sp. BETTINA12A]|uniref:helix-turn-helix domain-containing protein n=1 Tax=Neorhizobium sp. BETTINA12A TaxID=2908924 RepID=UPI001FF6EBF3|nr:helix-turn-helix transcriptional regulator [Neorhizobium sp. BETTINA12A]MCJ9749654.1 helix-turn-helix domain-containing protein [Neorhizobium sp. BETTINA12A]